VEQTGYEYSFEKSIGRRTFVQISLAQANRFLLKRQHLLKPTKDPLQAVKDACGLQAQIPSTPALSLRARVAGFTRADYDRMLREEKSIVRTWGMRGTVHVLPTDQLFQYLRVSQRDLSQYERYLQAEVGQLEAEAEIAYNLLREAPASRSELAERAVSRGLISAERAAHLFGPWGGVLHHLGRAGRTVHLPTEGRDVRLVPLVDWIGRALPEEPLEVLEDRFLMDYLSGYGPATVADFAHYTGMSVSRAQAIFDRAEDLAEVRLEGSSRPHYLPASLLPELTATTGAEPAPVHLLPRFDSLLLAHKEKGRILDDADRPKVFKPAAVVDATVLVDGRVVGTWTMTSTTRTLRFQFTPFRRTAKRPIQQAAKRLADWYGLTLEWQA
jgi:hypothetical protein